jgi:hypothetical protein
MILLLKYAYTTGAIRGGWVGSPASLLEAQIVVDDPGFGYLLSESDVPAEVLQQQWEVVSGVLTAKVALVLTPDVLTFAADGVATCTVSVVPFVACAVTVNNGSPMALTTGDETLVLTSDVPASFEVALVPMAGFWAESITLEAV